MRRVEAFFLVCRAHEYPLPREGLRERLDDTVSFPVKQTVQKCQ